MTDAAGVDPAEIVRQRAAGWPDFHPEDYCHRCGRPNPCWFADTTEWQTATGSTGDGGGILCPSCFCALWEQQTGKTAIIWRLSIDPRSRDARGPDTAGQGEMAVVLASHRLTTPRQCFCGEREFFEDGLHRPEGHVAHVLTALLPVVQRLAVEKAEEELRAAYRAVIAGELMDLSPDARRRVIDWLEGRADALVAAAQPTDGRTRE